MRLTPFATLLAALCLLVSVTDCGRSNRINVRSDRNNLGNDGTGGGGSNNNGGGNTTPQFRCQVIPSTTQITVPVDSNQRLYPGYQLPPVGFSVVGTLDGLVTAVSIPPQALPIAGWALTSPVSGTSTLLFGMRPPAQLGNLPVSFPISNAQNPTQVANCQTGITVVGEVSQALSVNITAEGAAGATLPPIASGQTVTINWVSNGSSCVLKVNGQVQPNYVTPYGEFESLALTNTTANQTSFVFEASCTGGPANETRSATVTVRVNPGVNATLNLANNATARSITLAKGGDVDLVWTSQFATRCELSDGTNGQPVALNGNIHIENFQATVTWRLTCFDTRTSKSSSIVVTVVEPAITTLTANGTSERLVKPSTGDINISWTARDVSGCVLNPGAIAVQPNGTRIVANSAISADITYTLTCNSPLGGTVTKSVVIDVVGQWYSVNVLSCPTYCSNIGKTNRNSPEGAKCASGEQIPPSSVGIVNYRYGCWPSCAPHFNAGSASSNGYCYGPDQKRDWDATDLTVGCFCG